MRIKTINVLTVAAIAAVALTGCAGESEPAESSTTQAPTTSAATDAPETDAAETDAPDDQATGAEGGAFTIPASCEELVDPAVLSEDFPGATPFDGGPTADELVAEVGASESLQGISCAWQLPSGDGGVIIVAAEIDPSEGPAAEAKLVEEGLTPNPAFTDDTVYSIDQGGATGSVLIHDGLLLYAVSSGDAAQNNEILTYARDAVLNGSE